MTEIVVRTQQELDAALNEPANHAMRDGVDDDQVVSALVTASENVDSAIHDTKHAFAIYLRRVEA